MATFDDHLTIATPEGVDLELVLAGLGARFAATLLDLLIQVGAIIALATLLGLASDSGWALAVFLVLAFLVLFAYDIALETWNHGRSVGKLAVGLRVVRIDGEPEGFLTAAVRNLLRIADFLPAFYVVGTIAIVATSRNQRLGDLAAGTDVVRERHAVPASFPAAPPALVASPPGWDVSNVSAEDVAIVREFLARRASLAAAARAQLALDLASRLQPKVVGDARGWHPESFLEAVVAAKTSRA